MNDARPHWIPFALGVLFALVPAMPFAATVGDTSHWPMHAASAVLIVLLAGSSLKINAPRGPLPPHAWAAIALTALALSSFWTTELFAASEARYTVGRYAGYAAALLTGWLFGLRGIPALAWGLLGAGSVEAMSAISDVAANTKAMADPYLAPGIMGHKNFTTSALALSLPAAWWVYRQNQGTARFIAVAVGLLAVTAIVLLRTRSIWVGTAIWVVFTIVRGIPSWKPLALAAGLGVLVLWGVLARPQAREALMDPTNLSIREVFWTHSLRMIHDAPWTGIGAGQWRIHFPGYGLTGMNPSVAEGVTAEVRPHNDALWVAAEHGWPGFLVWCSVWVGIAISWWKLRRHDGADLVMGMSILILTYSMFEFPLERAAVWIPFMLAAGMLRTSFSEPKPVKHFWIPVASTLLLALPYGYTSVQGIRSERAQEELLQLNAQQNAVRLLPAALASRSDWNELDRFGNPSPYFAGMSALFLEAQRAPISPTSFAEAESHFQQSLSLHPHHVVTWYQLGNLYRYRGDAARAESAYRELLKRSPRHPGGQMHLAHALLAQNRPEEAAATLFSAFGTDAYYAQNDFRSAAIQSLRQCPPQVAMKGLQVVVAQRDSLDDNQLFAAFLAQKSTYL